MKSSKVLNILLKAILASIIFFESYCDLSAHADVHLAQVIIDNVSYVPSDSVEFDIVIKSESELLRFFANASLYVTLKDTAQSINKEELSIEYIHNTSELSLEAVSGGAPKYGYVIKTEILNGAAAISIFGAEIVEHCKQTNPAGIKLGRFKILSKNGKINSRPAWNNTDFHKSVCAFKLPNDIFFNGKLVLSANDNIEAGSLAGIEISYNEGNSLCENTVIGELSAIYTGGGDVAISFETDIECRTNGFVILRYKSNTHDIDIWSEQPDTIASYLQDGALRSSLSGANSGRRYEFTDRGAKAGENICYALHLADNHDIVRYANKIFCLTIPDLTLSYITASPNPFREQAVIEYFLERESYITASVYDLRGAEASRLLVNMLVQPGRHFLSFSGGNLSTQGFYECIITALPASPIHTEKSTASIKLQLVK